jgi:tetratricopeptide (TPR) repeat protein
LALSPLSQSETLSLIGVLAPPDHDFGDRVWKTSEGNPFMAIESVRALLDDGDTEGQERSDLPLRIRGIVAGRLDRLTGRARQLLAAAAVIGRDFEFELMRTAAGLDEAESVAGVEELVARHILRGSGARFDFTHDVIRQIAYDELLPPRRKLLHRRTAEELERDRPGRQGPSNATLARHYLAAEVWGKAARYWRSAGADAVERSAYRESVTCFEQALTAGAYLDDGREATEHAIDTRLDLYHALIPLGQPARLIGILREADERAAAVGAQARLGWIAAYRANCLWLRGEPDLAAEASERARKVATALDIFDLRIVADFYLGQAYHFAGRYRDAVGVLKENIERLGNDRAQERFGLPGFASVILRGWLCWSLAELGEFEESMAHGQQALKIAEAADHPFSLLDAYREVGCLYIRLGDFPRATALLERGLALAQSRDLALWLPSIGSALGYALALSGRHSEGLALLDQSVEQASTLGIVAGHAQRIAWLAEAHLFVGEAARAETLAEHALELSTRHNERGHRAWCLRLIGEIALRRPDPDPEKAAEFFVEALGSAEGLGMLPLAVLCQRGLAEASPQLGRRESG